MLHSRRDRGLDGISIPVLKFCYVPQAMDGIRRKAKEAQELKAGITVVIRPGIVHWHGASADSEFSHISIIPNPEENEDTWLDAVGNKDYATVNASLF